MKIELQNVRIVWLPISCGEANYPIGNNFSNFLEAYKITQFSSLNHLSFLSKEFAKDEGISFLSATQPSDRVALVSFGTLNRCSN